MRRRSCILPFLISSSPKTVQPCAVIRLRQKKWCILTVAVVGREIQKSHLAEYNGDEGRVDDEFETNEGRADAGKADNTFR